MPSKPLGGKLRAFSARFPERDRVDPTRAHAQFVPEAPPASVFPHVRRYPEGIML